MKSRLKIAERMVLGFGLMLLVMAAFAWVMDRQTGKIEAAHRELIEQLSPVSDAADRLELRVLYVAIASRSYLVSPSLERLVPLERQLREAQAALLALELLPRSPDSAETFDQVQARLDGYFAECRKFIERAETNVPQPERIEQSMGRLREEALEALRIFSKLQRVKIDRALAAIQTASVDAERVTSLGVVVALILFVALASLTVRSVREPAQRLVEIARRLEQGDWTLALQLGAQQGARSARDELGILRDAFGAAARALERREQRLKTDALVARAAGSSLSREEVARSALEAICAHLQAGLGAVYSASARGELRPIASRGFTATPLALDPGSVGSNGAGSPQLGTELVGRAMTAKMTQALHDSLGTAWLVRKGEELVPARSVVAVPVTSRGEVLGVVVVASLGELGAEAISFLEAAAGQLGIGLVNVVAHEQIKTLVSEVSEKGEHIQAQNEELQVQNEELQTQGQEIRAQNEELQSQSEEIKAQNDELARATARLRAQAEVLAEEDERKTEFLGVLAHELRNPLAAISNSLFALTHADGNQALRERAEQVIGRQSKLLARLIDDLLYVTRINSGKIRIDRERLDLAAVLRTSVEDSKAAADSAGARVELRLPLQPAMVDGDPVRVQQVLSNLIDNAIKFGGKEKPIVVTLTVKGDRSTEVRVVDEGLGIDTAMLNRLFVPFSQADMSVQRHRSGLGLGLALVKALVELHGGSVTASSAGLGKGAQFCVRFPPPWNSLPLPAPKSPSPSGTQRATTDGEGRRAA